MSTTTETAVAASAEIAAAKTIAADQLAHEGEYRITRCDQIRKSPDNRKRFNELGLQELAANIKAIGVAQPILIRPVPATDTEPEPFEIVAGERRWRASVIAGVATIPTMIRTLSDLDAAKIRILENLQREDPHPMEEAEGFQLLMLKHGYSADQLAEEVSKSRAYVYATLKLCALSTDVREQFLDDKIPKSTALLVARIPVPALQARVVDEILYSNAEGGVEPMSYRQAAQYIQTKYMLDLKAAPFQLTDAKLLPAAGACSTCPKRTGAQPEIYADVSADVCTDPDCYTEKRAAHTDRLIAAVVKKGIPFFDTMAEGQKYATLNNLLFATNPSYFLKRIKMCDSWKKIGGAIDAALYPPVAAYVLMNGALTAMYEFDKLQAAFEKAGLCAPVTDVKQAAEQSIHTPAQAKKLAAQKAYADAHHEKVRIAAIETSFRVKLYKQLRARASNGFSLESLREFAKLVLLDDNGYSLPDDLLDVYGLDNYSDKSVCAYIDQASLPQVQLILVDIVLGECLGVQSFNIEDGEVEDDGGRFDSLRSMAAHEGIDHDEVREEFFPTPINLESMRHADLVEFITAHPARINELKDAILASPYVELVSMLERAAEEVGYVYGVDGFKRKVAEPALSQEIDASDQTASAAGDEAAKEADRLEPPPGLPPATLAPHCDDEDEHLAEAMEEAPPAAKTSKKAKASAKVAVKPASAVPAAKTPKAAPAAKDPATKPAKATLAPAEAWPFPKSSTTLDKSKPAMTAAAPSPDTETVPAA